MKRWISMTTLVAALASCSGSPADDEKPVGQVGLDHVVVLLPLPTTADDEGHLVRPDEVGSKGRILPEWAMPGPALVQNEDRATTLANLRMVATRLDPCWPSIAVTDLTRCERVLHVIWQPIVEAWEAGAKGMAAVDAGVHTFYRLGDREFTEVLAAMIALDAKTAVDPTLPLAVHPVIVSEGLGGAYYEGYRSLVLEHAGERNLFQMTFLGVRASSTQKYVGQGWLLSGAQYEKGQAYRVVVATTSDNEQHFGNNVNGPSIEDESGFVGDFIPKTANDELLLKIAADSKVAMTAPASEIQAGVDAALKIENPLLNTLDSVDCMACHVATGARVWAEKNRGIDTSNNPNRYTSTTFDLTLTSESATRSNALHGLGYYGTHTSISQRTVNDAAAAADFINTNLLRRP
jgi:hypothetical protein